VGNTVSLFIYTLHARNTFLAGIFSMRIMHHKRRNGVEATTNMECECVG
jgi:hypothetical protein